MKQIMNDNNNINWDMLAKELAGETDEEEKKEISVWLEASESHSVLFTELGKYWNKVNSIKEMNQFDVNNGWEKLHSRIVASSGISEPGKKEEKHGRIVWFSMPVLKIAAAIALIVMIGIGSYVAISGIQKRSQITVISSANDDRTRVTLPDGTLVFLNANTRISYSKRFNSGLREVRLAGEAYFDVTHNPEKPFLVYARKAGIKVLGTSFNVQAIKSSGKVEVFVESGKVQLFETENTNNTITIEPGFIGTIENETVEKQKNNDENYLAWKTRKLTFSNTDMAKVAKGIQDVFKVKVVFDNPAMVNCRIESHFENETLENVLDAVCTLFNWEWEIKGDKVTLSGAGC
jgi:transmembrane sensor